MPVFNQSRSYIIRFLFVLAFLIILAQLFNLQILSSEYEIKAEQNALQLADCRLDHDPLGARQSSDRHYVPWSNAGLRQAMRQRIGLLIQLRPR